jgi:hypothetical protein
MPNEVDYRTLVKMISSQLGAMAAIFFQQLYRHAITKQPCDICLKEGQIYKDVTIGADFVHALEFEAPVETVVAMLSRVKLIVDQMAPVVSIALEDICGVIPMPKEKVSNADVGGVDVRTRLGERNAKGQTLESYIRSVYKPSSEQDLIYYAARYLLSLATSSS